MLVVVFHLFEGLYPTLEGHPMRHGYLAVDFFFMLSGFVVGYAYDDRWQQMHIKDFFRIRLIRLHPLVILAVSIGAIFFLLDPYTEGKPPFSMTNFLLAIVLGWLLLPAPDIRGWAETHPLVGPCWSLLQEYIANILYALALRKMKQTLLAALAIGFAILLIGVAHWRGDIGTGWGYDTFWIACVRMLFPFTAGLFIFRAGWRINMQQPVLLTSFLLILAFSMPYLPYNGLYEAGMVILIFPLILMIGAGSSLTQKMESFCKLSGEISYPIYITHYPFIYIYTSWIHVDKPERHLIALTAAGLFFLFLLIAWFSSRLYDIPVRKWLNRRWS